MTPATNYSKATLSPSVAEMMREALPKMTPLTPAVAEMMREALPKMTPLTPAVAEMMREALPKLHEDMHQRQNIAEMMGEALPKMTPLSPSVAEMMREALPKMTPLTPSVAEMMREALPKLQEDMHWRQSVAEIMREALPNQAASFQREVSARNLRDALDAAQAIGSREGLSEPRYIGRLASLPVAVRLNLFSIYLGFLLALSLLAEDMGSDVPDALQHAIGAVAAGAAAIAETLKALDPEED